MTIKLTITAETVDELREKLRAAASTFAGVNDKRDDGWIPWHGGACPVDGSQLVEVKLRDGSSWGSGRACGWVWEHHDTDSNVIAYRVIDK